MITCEILMNSCDFLRISYEHCDFLIINLPNFSRILYECKENLRTTTQRVLANCFHFVSYSQLFIETTSSLEK